MESDLRHTFFFKYVFLLISVMSGITGIISYFVPELVVVNGEPSNFDLSDYALTAIFIVLGLILHLLTSHLFIRVRLDGQNINLIYKEEEEEAISWLNVDSVNKIPFLFPPLYKLRFKDKSGLLLFTTKPEYIQFGFGTADLSEMGNFIEKKKREFGI